MIKVRRHEIRIRERRQSGSHAESIGRRTQLTRMSSVGGRDAGDHRVVGEGDRYCDADAGQATGESLTSWCRRLRQRGPCEEHPVVGPVHLQHELVAIATPLEALRAIGRGHLVGP
jgi:hypothetical protein